MDYQSLFQAFVGIGWLWAQAHSLLDKMINDFFEDIYA